MVSVSDLVSYFPAYGRSSPLRTRKTPFSGWNLDNNGALILLHIPSQLDLNTTIKGPSDYSNPLLDLPPELHHAIAEYLHPVDRVCLALTCKTLAASLLSCPRLTHRTWPSFVEGSPASGDTHTNRNHQDKDTIWLLPESYSLITRLAHGWTPKAELRYCWKCNKILSREKAYFKKRMRYYSGSSTSFIAQPPSDSSVDSSILRVSSRIVLRPCNRWLSLMTSKLTTWTTPGIMPKWSAKLDIPQEEWNLLSKRQRYEYILNLWCYAKTEDSSCLYCEHCKKARQDAQSSGMSDKTNAPPASERDAAPASSQSYYPVECPLCLERELTFVWHRQSLPRMQDARNLFRWRASWWIEDVRGWLFYIFVYPLAYVGYALTECCRPITELGMARLKQWLKDRLHISGDRSAMFF